MDEGTKDEKKVDDKRRSFLKATVVASAALAVGGIASIAKLTDETEGYVTSTSEQTSFPDYVITDIVSGVTANVNTMEDNQYLTFNYPLDNEPNLIMKLGVSVPGGVGPNSDIVAFSDLCQHLGCNPGFVPKGQSPPVNKSYVAPDAVLYCPCHGSIYDLTDSAKVVGGPALYPVPQVMLHVDSSGNIHAIGMGPPTIYQHGTPGSDDVTPDLDGGTLVTALASSSSESS